MKVLIAVLTFGFLVALAWGECSENHFTCKDGLCIPLSYQCDGEPDCIDKSDEDELFANCTCEFKCTDGSCIPEEYVCDFYPDCDDGIDEENCTCEDTCADGSCLPPGWTCDGWDDCGDNSDEIDCPCEDDTDVKCADGNCIPEKYLCDGVQDCPDESDEMNCTSSYKPPSRKLEKMQKLTFKSRVSKLSLAQMERRHAKLAALSGKKH